jgi:hypothetical protein
MRGENLSVIVSVSARWNLPRGRPFGRMDFLRIM